MEKVIGIEVKGEVYRIEDEETSGKTQTLEAKIATAETNIENLETTATEQAEKVAKIETNIGTIDISELSETVIGHTGELTEISEELPNVKTDIDSVLFGKLELLKKGAGDNFLGSDDPYEDINFNIRDWAKYKGVALVYSSKNGRTGVSYPYDENLRKLETFLKMPDGTLYASLHGAAHGEKLVINYHTFRVSSTGEATLVQGYSPKEDRDSEDFESQEIFPTYEIYGIL